MNLASFRFFLGRKISASIPFFDLTLMQRASYCNLVSKNGIDALEGKSMHEFVHAVDPAGSLVDLALREVFPISDSFGKVLLEYLSCSIKQPKVTANEAIEQSVSYVAPVYGRFRMVVFDVDPEDGSSEIVSIKEQDVHLFDLPVMSDEACSFILNGVERVVLSQVHRSPGVFFDCDRYSSVNSYSARIIPHKGSWIDFEFSASGALSVRVNKRRKFPVAVFLSAMGFSASEALLSLCSTVKVLLSKGIVGGGDKPSLCLAEFHDHHYPNRVNAPFDLYNKDGKVVVRAGAVFNPSSDEEHYIDTSNLEGRSFICSTDSSGNVLLEPGTVMSSDTAKSVVKNGVDFYIVNPANVLNPSFAFEKGFSTHFESRSDAMRSVLKSFLISTPSDNTELAVAFEKLLFNSSYFTLSDIGRYKMNRDLNLNVDEGITHLTKDDITGVVKCLLYSRHRGRKFSDTDSLSNRRIRSVGELLKNQLDSSLLKVARLASEKLNLSSASSLLPAEIIPSSVVISDIKEFLLLSKLSQFIDQVNPLADLVHKRRITALGNGGLARERAGFDVRDVHYSHYGRICPIETPEGQNIGLINSPAYCAKVDKYGFMVVPYRKVVEQEITDTIEYLGADREKKHIIAQISDGIVDDSGNLVSGFINCRYDGDFCMRDASEVEYIEVSPRQILSVSSSLIPFVDHNDASRALMGANMQRQAVPLLFASPPLIGTGIEKEVVERTNFFSIRARRPGRVDSILQDAIVVRVDDKDSPFDVYRVRCFNKTNHGTVFHHVVKVNIDDVIKAGDILADGSATKNGEFSPGKDLLVAFMPWNGYNFEDAMVISERVVRDRVYSSIHIEEYDVLLKDTKLGQEEIVRDVPGVPEHLLSKLDESGIVEIGSYVQAGDVLVGKVTPKAEDVLMPEEKLLRAIFGDKNNNCKNTSLVVPPGVSGVVIDVKVFVRPGVKKNERARAIEEHGLYNLDLVNKKKIAIVNSLYNEKVDALLDGVSVGIGSAKAAVLSMDELINIELAKKFGASVSEREIAEALSDLHDAYVRVIDGINERQRVSVNNIVNGSGNTNQKSLVSVKVYIASERSLQPGDKMAGRHGNKGVVSIVLPVEDMPFMEDGTPVDIVLNPLGVASRMNIGQVLETHLALVASTLGKRLNKMLDAGKSRAEVHGFMFDVMKKVDPKERAEVEALSDDDFVQLVRSFKRGVRFAVTPFESIGPDDIGDMLEVLGLDRSGQFELHDGRTGEAIERKVTVGYMHILKLHHLVEDKVHARSVGPYSLVTQQPLGGRMHFGGQRFGEMECWALQAYGAAYTLQEMITVKSDDINGRIAVYESIVKGNDAYFPGMPESFNVMMKELRSLCLNVELESSASESVL